MMRGQELRAAKAEIERLRRLLVRIGEQVAPSAGICSDCERVYRWVGVELSAMLEEECAGDRHVWPDDALSHGATCICGQFQALLGSIGIVQLQKPS